MGEGIAVIDFNGDGIADKVGLRWASYTSCLGVKCKEDSLLAVTHFEPVITSAEVGTKNKDKFIDVETLQGLEACGKSYKVGQKFPDSPSDHKSPITRVLTSFSLKTKEERNLASREMEYSLRLYMQLEPEVSDGIHKKSARTICGPFFDDTVFADDPEKDSKVAGR